MRRGRIRLDPTTMAVWAIGIVLLVIVVGGTISTLGTGAYPPSQLAFLFLNGVTQGAIYALIALGYTMVYGVLQMINFAHSEVFMSGPYIASFVAVALNRSGFLNRQPVLSLLLIFAVAMATSTLLALTLERVAYRPLRRAPRLVPLITAIGASFFLQYAFRSLFGSSQKTFPDVAILKVSWTFDEATLRRAAFVLGIVVLVLIGLGGAYLVLHRLRRGKEFLDKALGGRDLGGVAMTAVILGLFGAVGAALLTVSGDLTVGSLSLVVVVAAVLMMGGLYAFLRWTKTGKAIRAVSEDKDAAALMGIDVDWVIATTFGIGGMLAGAAGVLFAFWTGAFTHTMGFMPGIKAFTCAVLGGIGNIPGAMFGGIFLGIVESLGPALFFSGWQVPSPDQLKDVIAFTMLVLVLIFRPTGLLGEVLARKKA